MFEGLPTSQPDLSNSAARSAAIRAWEVELKERGMDDNEKIVGELISAGTPLINYSVPLSKDAWSPHLITANDGRSMVYFTKRDSPRYGAETLEAGLRHAVTINASKSPRLSR